MEKIAETLTPLQMIDAQYEYTIRMSSPERTKIILALKSGRSAYGDVGVLNTANELLKILNYVG